MWVGSATGGWSGDEEMVWGREWRELLCGEILMTEVVGGWEVDECEGRAGRMSRVEGRAGVGKKGEGDGGG